FSISKFIRSSAFTSCQKNPKCEDVFSFRGHFVSGSSHLQDSSFASVRKTRNAKRSSHFAGILSAVVCICRTAASRLSEKPEMRRDFAGSVDASQGDVAWRPLFCEKSCL